MNKLRILIDEKWPDYLFYLFLIIIFVIGWKFSISNNLSGFFDDGTVYLMAASIFNGSELDVYMDSYETNRSLPVGFSYVLYLLSAITPYKAHIVVLSQFILMIVSVYYYYKIILNNSRLSVFLVTILVFMPGHWIELLKISSEMQYMLLVFIALGMWERHDFRYKYITLGVLVAACVVTRSVGVTLFVALVLLVSTQKSGRYMKLVSFIVGVVMVAIPLIASIGNGKGSGYASSMSYLFEDNWHINLILVLKANMISFFGAWMHHITLYSAETSLVILSVILLLIFSLVIFLRRKKLDGIYLIAYLSVLSVWPYPEDMTRLIYPVVPFIPLYLWFFSKKFISGFSRDIYYKYVPTLLLVALTVPASAAIYHRYDAAGSMDIPEIRHLSKFYETEDIMHAYVVSKTSTQYMSFLKRIGFYVNESRVLSLKPEIVTYVGGVYASMLPAYKKGEASEFLSKIKESGAEYIWLSGLAFDSYPMGMSLLSVLERTTDTIYYENYFVSDQPAFALLKIRR